MELNSNEKEVICSFFNACNKLIEGKFLIYAKKVSSVLESVAKSKMLYKLYSSCMANDFNFDREYSLAAATNPSNGGYFVLPDDESKIIAFTTSLLLEVDKGKISLENFINQNFYTGEGQNYDHKQFAQTILVPYKTAVKNVLNVDEEGNLLQDEEEEESYSQVSIEESIEDSEYECSSKKLFANLIISVNNLYTTVSSDIRMKSSMREEICLVLKALNKAISLEELLIINALLVHLEYTLGKNKKYKYEFNNLKENLADFYYS